MFELAPHHKYGLALTSPVMPASGTVGYGDAYADMVDFSLLGALVTNPVSLRPRKAARGQRLRIHGNHLVVHTGLPNPGVKRVIQHYKQLWERSPVPVIVHVIATTPTEVLQVTTRLANLTGVVGIELGLADYMKPERAVQMVHAAVESTLPIIARIPFGRVDDLAIVLAEGGASALTLTAPPRVVLPSENADAGENQRYIRGRMYGQAVFPLLLGTLARWTRKLPVPVIACGGIQNAQEAFACLNLGATAVQLDAVIWRQPCLLEIIVRELEALVAHLIDKNTVNDNHVKENINGT